MNQKINAYIESLDLQIQESRKIVLDELAQYVREKTKPKLNFICTHNSRRSHLSQVWAQVMASHFGIEISTFSGGTEATAFHPNAIAALTRAGFEITSEGAHNSKYHISYDEGAEPMICFSKVYDHAINPQSDFAAIMTCSEADTDCPFIPGAKKRIKLFYQDPKVSDGTASEEKTYDERCAQIASEMHYVFSQIRES